MGNPQSGNDRKAELYPSAGIIECTSGDGMPVGSIQAREPLDGQDGLSPPQARCDPRTGHPPDAFSSRISARIGS